MGNILFVDDEAAILKAIKRLFSISGYDILTAASGEEALKIISQKNISVLVTDQRMPGMLGTELVAKSKEISPRTVRMILSGYTDLNSVLEAINKGEIFRFLLKPWRDDELLKHVVTALEIYQKSKDQNDQLLLALAQTIELKDPYTKGHCDRVATYAVALARELGLAEEAVDDICHGAWLHDCGKIGTHEDILNMLGKINDQQMLEIKKHPMNGAKVAEKAGLPQSVVNIIRYHHERIDGAGYPSGLAGEEIPIEAKIVAVADVYDAISTDRPYRKACNEKHIDQIMQDSRGSALDAELVDLLMQKVICKPTQIN